MNLQGSNTYNKVKNKNLQNTTQDTVRTVTKYHTGHCQNSYKIPHRTLSEQLQGHCTQEYHTGHCQNSYKIQHRTLSEQLQNTTQDTVRTVTKYNTGHRTVTKYNTGHQQKNRRMRHNRKSNTGHPPPLPQTKQISKMTSEITYK